MGESLEANFAELENAGGSGKNPKKGRGTPKGGGKGGSNNGQSEETKKLMKDIKAFPS